MADEKDYLEEQPEDERLAGGGEAGDSPEAAEPVEAAAEQVEQPAEASPKNWFIIHTYSGFENKVAGIAAHARRGLRVSPIRSGRF